VADASRKGAGSRRTALNPGEMISSAASLDLPSLKETRLKETHP
jgi:hypothetical protein